MIDLTAANSVVTMIDMQERLVPAMNGFETLTDRMKVFLAGCAALKLRTVVTEQYPKGLGTTLECLKEVLSPEAVFLEKTSFSCFGTEQYVSEIEKSAPKNLILCGVESHVCVLQTALDAKKRGMNVILVTDCASSRHVQDKECAFSLMRQEKIQLMTIEMILFMLMQNSRHEAFKTISKLIR